MERRSGSDNQVKPAGRMTAIYNDFSWSIVYSEDENCLYIRANDYHAGPLKIDRALAAQIGNTFSGYDRDKDEVGHEPDGGVHRADKKADTSKKPAPNDLVIKLNKKDRCAEIEVAEGWKGVIKLPRKELYRLGKKLGKRARFA